MKILLNLQQINTKIFKKYKAVKAAGIYGSCAKGTNTEKSDIDLWVKLENLEQETCIKLASELRSKLENINILFLDNKKLETLKKVS